MKSASTISLVAVLALASQAVAEPLGTGNVLMSTRDLFTLKGRSNEGYKSKVAVCGLGADCSSCGSTFELCSSDDQYIHCFDSSAGGSCCSDGSGNSCDAGFYCYPGKLSKTLCCPEGIDSDTCKSLYGSSLTSVLPSSTLTSASSSSTSSSIVSTTSAASATSATSTVTKASTGKPSAVATGAVFYDGSGKAAVSGSNATNATATYSKTSATASLTGSSSSSTSSETSISGAVPNAAASFLALFGAAIAAAML